MKFTESERLQQLSNEYILGGVNSPSRSYKAVGGGAPVVMKEGHGAYLYDVDGNKYIDYLRLWTNNNWSCTSTYHRSYPRSSSKRCALWDPTELEINSQKLRKLFLL